MCSNPCICTTQQYSVFFQWSFAQSLKNISLIIWYCCNSWCPYNLIFCTKQTRKQAHFIDNIRHIMWPLLNAFILHAVSLCVFVRKHQKVCCSIRQWSDVGTSLWCRTCTVRFFRRLLRKFSSFPPIWVCKIKVLWKVASSRAEDLKTVFFFIYILSRVQREEFYYYKAVCCKSYVQLLIQDVYSISSKTCQL